MKDFGLKFNIYEFVLEGLNTGSRVICNPPPVDTDDDYLFLVDTAAIKSLEEKLVEEGFIQAGSMDPNNEIEYQYLWSKNNSGEIHEDIFHTDTGYPIGYKTGTYTLLSITPLPKKSTQAKNLEEWPDYQNLGENHSHLFHSWKKDQLNFILTASLEYFENFYRATILAKKLNLLKKEDRITLFEAIVNDRWP